MVHIIFGYVISKIIVDIINNGNIFICIIKLVINNHIDQSIIIYYFTIPTFNLFINNKTIKFMNLTNTYPKVENIIHWLVIIIYNDKIDIKGKNP